MFLHQFCTFYSGFKKAAQLAVGVILVARPTSTNSGVLKKYLDLKMVDFFSFQLY